MSDEKKVPFLDKEINGDKVTFTLGNGQQVVVNKSDVSPENWERAALHGISQRLGDACANLSKGKEYGKALEALTELKAQLAQKEWTKGREAGNKQQIEDLIEALSKLKKVPAEVVRAAVEKANQDKRKSWISNKAIAAEMAEIKSKRLKKEAKGNMTVDDIDLELETDQLDEEVA
jgi:PAB1-binding protein PBP1